MRHPSRDADTSPRCSSDCASTERDLIGDELETHGIVPSIGRAGMVEPNDSARAYERLTVLPRSRGDLELARDRMCSDWDRTPGTGTRSQSG